MKLQKGGKRALMREILILATISVLGLAIVFFLKNPEDYIKITPGETSWAAPSTTKKVEEPRSFAPSAGNSSTFSPQESFPHELSDPNEHATYAEIAISYDQDPASSLPKLLEAYENSVQAKAYWARAIAYVYIDDIKDPAEALNWFEIAMAQGENKLEMIDSAASLYVQNDELRRAEAFIDGMDDGPMKNMLLAKIFMAMDKRSEAVEFLKNMRKEDLDAQSRDILNVHEGMNLYN